MACKIDLYARKHMLDLTAKTHETVGCLCDLVTTFSLMEGQRTAIVGGL